jgi:hypothetical protein
LRQCFQVDVRLDLLAEGEGDLTVLVDANHGLSLPRAGAAVFG